LYYLGGMNTIKNLLTNLCNLLDCACELFRYAVIFLWAIFSPKAVLAAKLPAVESQLAACKLCSQNICSATTTESMATAYELFWKAVA
jgi:hypothetical protein